MSYNRPLLDTEILLYASIPDSPFYKESIRIIEENLFSGFFITDINLIELFNAQHSSSLEEAFQFIRELTGKAGVTVIKARSLSELASSPDLVHEVERYSLNSYDINSYLIADCMREHDIKVIITYNKKEYEKFEWVNVIIPETGGERRSYLPYSRQSMDENDIAAVCSVLRSDWLTTGPKVAEFEETFAKFVGARYAICVSSGTAALHAAMYAVGIGPGDEVIVPSITFSATANAVVYQGGIPVFADVDEETLLIDIAQVEKKITERTKAIIAVDYAGQPCHYDTLHDIAKRHNLALVADACHSLGGEYKGRRVGSLAALSAFSFHPVKHITTGEGGMITTDDPEYASRLRNFRNHGITSDHHKRKEENSWFYAMVELGYNYRLTDFQCALGISQLRRLPAWIERRQEIAGEYDKAFQNIPAVEPLKRRPDVSHAYHLYVVKLKTDLLAQDRDMIFSYLRARDIGVNVHYIPVHLHPFYQKRFGTSEGLCPVAEKVYNQIISLPIFPDMKKEDNVRVVSAMEHIVH